jgi:hypothetical protein
MTWTEPHCLHTTRTRAMDIEQGTPATLTLWAERCHGCGSTFLHSARKTIEVHPDGTQVITLHGPDGGPRGPEDDSVMVNSIIGGTCE